MKTINALFVYFLTGIVAFSQGKPTSDPLAYPRQIVKQLCSPAMEGRGYVRSGCQKAARFLKQEFQTMGLLEYRGVSTQPFKLSVNTFPKACKLRFGWKNKKPGIDFIVNPSSGGYAGHLKVLSLNAQEILQYPFGKSKNRGYILSFVPRLGISADTLKMVRLKLEKLARIELPVLEFTREKLTWSVSSETFKYPYVQCILSTNEACPKQIHLKIDAVYKENITVENVFGYIPSKNPSDSLIILCAHYDHLGRMGRKTYFPGGNDNASGVGMLLSVAKKLKRTPLEKYNVLCIAFAGEEIGLVGSQAFLESPLLDRSKVSMVLNMDIMGSGEEGITVVNGSVYTGLFDRLVKINQTYGLLKAIKPRGKAANSDHFVFSNAGIPALFIYTMGENKNYHDVKDTYDALSFSAFNALETLVLTFLKSF